MGASGSAFAALGGLGGGGCSSGSGPGSAPRSGATEPDPGASEAAGAGTQRILILGGTKFLGPALVEASLARGHEVTLFNRGKTNPQLFPEVEKLRGDRDGDLEALKGRTWDAVIDTSGYVPRLVGDSARLLADGVGQYVFISSVSAYADFAQPGMDEGAPLATLADPTVEEVTGETYGGLKAASEAAAEAAMPGRVTNIRPGLIVGPLDPTDRFTYWPVRVARGGEVLAPGDGTDQVQFIDVRDLAAWAVHMIEGRHMGAYNALGPAAPLTMGSFLGTCKEVAGSDARLTWADAALLEAQGVSPWQEMPMWVPAEGDSAGFASLRSDRAQARGLVFRPVADTVRDTLAWFETLPEDRRSELRAGLTPEREAKVLAALHARG